MYYLAASFFSFVGLFVRKTKNYFGRFKPDVLMFFIASAFLVFLCGARGIGVGIDTHQYYNMYKQSAEWSWDQLNNSWQQGNLEIGFLLLEHFLAHILKIDFTVFCFVCSIVSIVPACYLIKKYSPNINASLFLYLLLGFYFFAFSAIRQCLCIGLLCIAFIFLEKRKLIPFLIITLLSSLFHISGLIMIPFYFFTKVKWTDFAFIVVLFGIILSFVFGNNIYSCINSFVRVQYSVDSFSGGFGLYFFIAFVCLAAVIFTRKQLLNDRVYSISFCFVIAHLLVWPFVRFNPSAFRLTYFFQLMLIIFIPMLISKITDVKLRVLLLIVITAVLVYYFIFYVYNDSNQYNNYSFFWQ